MAFPHGKDTRVLVGEYSFSARMKAIALGHHRDYADATAMGDSGARWFPGLRSGSLSLEGLFESGASGHAKIMNAIGVDNSLLVTVGPDGGFALGKPAFTALGDITDYNVPAAVKDLVGLKVDAEPDDGVDWGVALHDQLVGETATGNGSSVNNLAASTNGGAGVLHVLAAPGTTLIVKIQHSTNDSVWVDLVTFTTVTSSVASERILVAAGSTVNQYLRATWAITGAGPYTFVAAFARR